jgi:aminomethyltransferase
MGTDKKRTPLCDWHSQHGANMVEFGDYLMPVWYASARDEHMAVISRAGLFDTSHMAVVRVLGPGSFDLLQWCFTRDLHACVGKDDAPITPGRCVYGAFLDEHGHAVDDSIVYKVKDDEYVVVVNASMGGPVAAHLEAHKKRERLTSACDSSARSAFRGVVRSCQGLKAPDATLDQVYFSSRHFDPRPLRGGRSVRGRHAHALVPIGIYG